MEAKLEELSHALFVPEFHTWLKGKSTSPIEFSSAGSRHIVLGYTDSDLGVYVYSEIPLYSNPELRHFGFLENPFVKHSIVTLRLMAGPLAVVSIYGTPNLERTTSTFTYDIMRFVGDIAVVEKIPVKALLYKSGELPDSIGHDYIRHLLENRYLVSILSSYGERRGIIFHRGSRRGVKEFDSRLFDVVSGIITDENLKEQGFIELQRVGRLRYLYTSEELSIIAKLVSRHFKAKPIVAGKNVYVNGEFQGTL